MSILWKKPVMDHLMWYKENVIHCTGKGQWDGTPYRHIFPPDLTDLNFFDGKPPETRWLKKDANQPDEPLARKWGFDHMNSAWVMGLNLFPHLFDDPASEHALAESFAAQGVPALAGRTITRAWFEEPLADGFLCDVCLRLDDGQRVLIHLFYYNFGFRDEIPALTAAAVGDTRSVFVLLKQNTLLNPDFALETDLAARDNADRLHVIFWERWIPTLIALLSGDQRERCKELYRKNLDF